MIQAFLWCKIGKDFRSIIGLIHVQVPAGELLQIFFPLVWFIHLLKMTKPSNSDEGRLRLD